MKIFIYIFIFQLFSLQKLNHLGFIHLTSDDPYAEKCVLNSIDAYKNMINAIDAIPNIKQFFEFLSKSFYNMSDASKFCSKTDTGYILQYLSHHLNEDGKFCLEKGLIYYENIENFLNNLKHGTVEWSQVLQWLFDFQKNSPKWIDHCKKTKLDF